ncbi:hypothetical protein DMENIID0001_112030 [Sergentomyia squamirostris]
MNLHDTPYEGDLAIEPKIREGELIRLALLYDAESGKVKIKIVNTTDTPFRLKNLSMDTIPLGHFNLFETMTFTRAMNNEVLEGLIGTTCYAFLDDILVNILSIEEPTKKEENLWETVNK